jgi:hypothetical protein
MNQTIERLVKGLKRTPRRKDVSEWAREELEEYASKHDIHIERCGGRVFFVFEDGPMSPGKGGVS